MVILLPQIILSEILMLKHILKIWISQRRTRHVSRNLCYTTTPAVTISNTLSQTYPISLSQRLTRYV